MTPFEDAVLQRLDTLLHKVGEIVSAVDEVRGAVEINNRSLEVVVDILGTNIEMARQTLAAVTAESPGGSEISNLLRTLVEGMEASNEGIARTAVAVEGLPDIMREAAVEAARTALAASNEAPG